MHEAVPCFDLGFTLNAERRRNSQRHTNLHHATTESAFRSRKKARDLVELGRAPPCSDACWGLCWSDVQGVQGITNNGHRELIQSK